MLALGIWKELNGEGYNYFAAVELAKYYEHHDKNPKMALNTVYKILNRPIPLDEKRRVLLLHRKKRLKKKLSVD